MRNAKYKKVLHNTKILAFGIKIMFGEQDWIRKKFWKDVLIGAQFCTIWIWVNGWIWPFEMFAMRSGLVWVGAVFGNACGKYMKSTIWYLIGYGVQE